MGFRECFKNGHPRGGPFLKHLVIDFYGFYIDKTVPTVLVVAREDVVGALLGLLVELQGYSPVFADPNEDPETAIERLKPELVIVDCDHDALCSEHFFRIVEHIGGRAVVFSPSRLSSEVKTVAEAYGLDSFTLHITPHELGRVLERVLQASS